MKKLILLLLALLLVFALCACGEKVEPEVEEQNEEVNYSEDEEYEEIPIAEATPERLAALVISFNGTEFRIGDKYDDVKARLGDLVRPAQSFTPCGGNDDEQMTGYDYDGIHIEATHDGIICRAVVSGYEYPNSKATIKGIGIGATPNEVKSAFDYSPVTDSEYTINYQVGSYIISYSIDSEGTGAINYISIDDMNLAGV